jgi:hypothetical protein
MQRHFLQKQNKGKTFGDYNSKVDERWFGNETWREKTAHELLPIFKWTLQWISKKEIK